MSYFDDNEDAIVFGRGTSRYAKARSHLAPRRGYTEPANPPPVCDRCGKRDLKWRWADRWVLSEMDNSTHQCNPTTLDDFDDCSDLV